MLPIIPEQLKKLGPENGIYPEKIKVVNNPQSEISKEGVSPDVEITYTKEIE
jgi:hypothetical protein